MNIVMIIDNGKIIGGGDYALFKFAEHLAYRGHTLTIFAANTYPFFVELSKVKNLRIHVRNELPHLFKGVGRINAAWDKMYTTTYIEPYLKKNAKDIDYIIGYLRQSAIKASYLGNKYGIKTVNFVYETPIWLKQQLNDRFEQTYRGRFKSSWEHARLAYMNTDILIPNSLLTKQAVEAWVGRPINDPVYPGFDLGYGSMPIVEGTHIVYVGRLHSYKNVHEIIHALALCNQPPKLILVGTGEEEGNLRSLAQQLNVDCEFAGSVSEQKKWELIRTAKFMVFPSSFEGFGMPPGESLLTGKPCICADIPVLREIYGDTLEYIPEHDIPALAGAIQRLLSDPAYAKRRGEEGREYIKQRYNWNASAQALEATLLHQPLYNTEATS